MKNIFKKMILAVMTTTLVFAAVPATSAFAQGENPPTTNGEVSNEKLEKAWARQLNLYNNLGKGFEDIDAQIAKFQKRPSTRLLRTARMSLLLQAALDAFEASA